MIKKENGVDEVKEWKKNIPPIYVYTKVQFVKKVLPLKMIVNVHLLCKEHLHPYNCTQ